MSTERSECKIKFTFKLCKASFNLLVIGDASTKRPVHGLLENVLSRQYKDESKRAENYKEYDNKIKRRF